MTKIRFATWIAAFSVAFILFQFSKLPTGFHDTQSRISFESQKLINSIVNRFQPKLPASQIPANPFLLSVSTDTAPQKPFTLNTERTIAVSTKEDLTSFWSKLSGIAGESTTIATKFLSAHLPTVLKPGTKASVKFDTDGTLRAATWRVDDKSLVQVERAQDDNFVVQKIADTPQTRERIINGTIISSFIEAAQNAGLPLSLVDDYVDLLSDRVDFRRDLQPGDTFAIILDEKQGMDGKWLSTGVIKAACLMNAGKLKAVVRYQDKAGQWQSYNEQGEPIGSYFLRYPLQFTRISSVFTDARMHPVLGIVRPHNGVDFAAPMGTPVRAVADGTVEQAGYYGESGNMIRLKHNTKYVTVYLHMSKIGAGIHQGSHITRGQVIGAVGMTGLATGPHLHFGLFVDGKYVNPLNAKLPNVLNESDLASPQFVQASLIRLKNELTKVVVARNLKFNSQQG